MQDIKKFKRYTPDHELLERYFVSDSEVLFLISADGQDWYRCQSKFSDSTFKIMYDAEGKIVSAVTEPVSSENGIYAVSMLFPEDCSVAEIDNLPDGFVADGSWIFFNGKITKKPVDYIMLAEDEREKLLAEASKVISPLQDSVDLDIATEKETSLLLAWKKYRVLLNRIDTGLAPDIDWPEAPENVA